MMGKLFAMFSAALVIGAQFWYILFVGSIYTTNNTNINKYKAKKNTTISSIITDTIMMVLSSSVPIRIPFQAYWRISVVIDTFGKV